MHSLIVVDRNRSSDDPKHVKAIIQRRTWCFSLWRRHHRKQFLPWLLRPLFEWWQLGDVNPVTWNSYTDLHLNLAEKRFKISLFKSAIWGICCKPSSQVHSDWRRLLHMLIERRCKFGFSWFERINPYSPSTASGSSGFSRDHTFRSIENLTDGLHPLQHLFLIRHIPYTQRRATDPLNWDDTYLKKRSSQFYMAAIDAS